MIFAFQPRTPRGSCDLTCVYRKPTLARTAGLIVLLLAPALSASQSLPTRLASITASQHSGNGASEIAAATSNLGQLVFVSTASDLTDDGVDTGGLSNVFLRNRFSGSTQRVSRALSGAPDGDSLNADANEFADLIVFESSATNLVPGDSNGVADIFAYNATSGQTSLLSINEFGGAADGASRTPIISSNGRHVLFQSRAGNLDPGSGLTRPFFDLFVLDRDPDNNGQFDEPGTLRPVRVVQNTTGAASSPSFIGFDLSFDGRYVVYATSYRGVTAEPVNGIYNLYFHDRDPDRNGVFDEPGSVTTTLLSRTATGEVFSSGSRSPTISDSGERIAFTSVAPELAPACSDAEGCSVYVMELGSAAGSVDPTNRTIIDGLSGTAPRMSASGMFMTVQTARSTDLVIRQVDFGSSQPVCVSQFLRRGNRGCGRGLASDDGRFAFFESASSNLVPLDANATGDVFVFDRLAGPPASPPEPACDDRVDNDGNGLIDLADPGCYGAEDNDETPGEIVSLIAVADQLPAADSFITQDARGLVAFFPDFDIGQNGLRVAAWRVRRFTGPDSGDPVNEIRLSRFNPFHLTMSRVAEGTRPRVAVASTNRIHLSYQDSERTRILYTAGDFQTTQQFAPAICSTALGIKHRMTLDELDQPLIAFSDNCSDDVRIWRPGQSPVSLDSSTLPGVKFLAIDTSASGDTLLAYVDNVVGDGDDPEMLYYVRADSDDQILLKAQVGVPQLGNDLELASDINGLAHIAYTPLVNEQLDLFGPSIVYLVEQGGLLVRHDLFLAGGAIGGYEVELYFDPDGVTPNFLLFPIATSPNRPARYRHLTFRDGELVEQRVPAYKGQPLQLSAKTTAMGGLEYLYLEQATDNVLHGDAAAPPWQESPVSAAANNQLRDLGQRNNGTGDAITAAISFSSQFPGGLGELATHSPQINTGDWSRQVIGPASPQDSVSLSPGGNQLAQFDNQSRELLLHQRQPDGSWASEPVTTLAGFDSLDNVQLVSDDSGIPDGPALIIAIFRSGETTDQLVAYERAPGGASWQSFPLTTSPVTAIRRMSAARFADRGLGTQAVAAYSSDSSGELRMAQFDTRTKTWTDEFVDASDSGAVIGNFLSLALSEELRPSGPAVRVPTIVYDIQSRGGLRYAFKASQWHIWQPDESTPAGVLINGVDHQLLNQSRLSPVIAVARNDGQVKLLSRAGSEATPTIFQSETVSSDYQTDSPLRLLLGGRTYLGYTAGSTSTKVTTVASGNALGALPVAGESRAYSDNVSRGPSPASLVVNMCAEIIDAERNEGPAKGAALASPVPPDDRVLGGWAEIFGRTGEGQRYIDFYGESFPKIARIVATDPGLLQDSINTLQDFMPGIQAMTEGNGNDVFLTQQMMDNALDIWQRLADRDAGPLSAFIELELTQWNDLQDFVDMSFDQWGTTIGLTVGPVSGADLLFSDSFEN